MPKPRSLCGQDLYSKTKRFYKLFLLYSVQMMKNCILHSFNTSIVKRVLKVKEYINKL